MAGRAAKKNIGGGTFYDGANSNVAKEAKEKNTGGAAVSTKVKRAYGGRTVGKHGGFKAGGRLDKRARGGGIRKFAEGGGADKSPFSSAATRGDKGDSNEVSSTKLTDVGGRKFGGSVKKK